MNFLYIREFSSKLTFLRHRLKRRVEVREMFAQLFQRANCLLNQRNRHQLLATVLSE